MVLLISIQFVPPFVDDCHLVTVPVCPLNDSVPELVPLQTIASELTVPPCETGSTVIVNVEFDPLHPLALGRTETIAVIGAEAALIAVKEGIFPVPFADRPIVVLLFPQV